MRTINVYGTGLNAVKFVLQNKDITIEAFIEGKKKNIESFMTTAFYNPVPVVYIEDAEKLLRKNYTVVAASVEAYWEIKKKLEEDYDLVEFEHFEPFETFRKKVAIIYGNCHTTPVKEALNLSKKFSRTYGFYPMKLIQDIKSDGGG